MAHYDQVLRAAFPWVARRLLSDPDPSIRQMLVQVLYQLGFAKNLSDLAKNLRNLAKNLSDLAKNLRNASDARAGAVPGRQVPVPPLRDAARAGEQAPKHPSASFRFWVSAVRLPSPLSRPSRSRFKEALRRVSCVCV